MVATPANRVDFFALSHQPFDNFYQSAIALGGGCNNEFGVRA